MDAPDPLKDLSLALADSVMVVAQNPDPSRGALASAMERALAVHLGTAFRQLSEAQKAKDSLTQTVQGYHDRIASLIVERDGLAQRSRVAESERDAALAVATERQRVIEHLQETLKERERKNHPLHLLTGHGRFQLLSEELASQVLELQDEVEAAREAQAAIPGLQETIRTQSRRISDLEKTLAQRVPVVLGGPGTYHLQIAEPGERLDLARARREGIEAAIGYLGRIAEARNFAGDKAILDRARCMIQMRDGFAISLNELQNLKPEDIEQ